MARSSEGTVEYAQKRLDTVRHCQRRDFTQNPHSGANRGRKLVTSPGYNSYANLRYNRATQRSRMKRFLTAAFVLASLFAYCQTKDHPDREIKATVDVGRCRLMSGPPIFPSPPGRSKQSTIAPPVSCASSTMTASSPNTCGQPAPERTRVARSGQ